MSKLRFVSSPENERPRGLRTRRNAAILFALVLAVAGLTTACSSGGGGGGGSKASAVSVAPGTVLNVRNIWAVYIADEATTGPGGTDMNGDNDFIDGIAVALDMKKKDEFVLNVQAIDVLLVGAEVYIFTRETADGRDWNSDGALDDLVLLHWSQVADTLTFIDVVADVDRRAVAAANRLYYVADVDPMGADSNLRYLRPENPTFPITVALEDGMARRVGILGYDEEMLFATADETIAMLDLNGDGDMDDVWVVSLLDTSDPNALLLNTSLAAPGEDVPYRARKIGTGDWLVAFLVSEAAHSDLVGGGFNDPMLFSPTWQPSQCVGEEDADLTDNVLHFLYYEAWMNNPAANPPVNTGLVGRRTIAIPDSTPLYIATLSREIDEGTCDLNGDGDNLDRVVRWMPASTPALPFTSASQIYAVADIAGGGSGLVTLEYTLVIAVSESDQNEDIDGDGEMDWNLLAWMNPEDGNGAFWRFDHDEGSGQVFVGTDWMATSEDEERLLSTFEEEVFGFAVNTGDNDLADSIPTWALLDGNDDLDFPGENVAATSGNAGMRLYRRNVYYRVDESDDNRDWNRDGDRGDSVLFRTNIQNGSSDFVDTLNDLDRPSVVLGDAEFNIFGGAYVVNEGMADKDLNKDGDRNDYVIRYFKISN